MKIACVDKTAADRLHLQKKLEEAYEYSRKTVGHISVLHPYPASKDEVLLHSPPDLIFVGPGFAFEEAFNVCRDINKEFPRTALFLLLSPPLYTLRTLRRFQRYCSEIFSTEETPTRLLHQLTNLELTAKRKTGKLITVSGVKGGVGTTSIVSGLAHGAQALGFSAIILDLSETGSLVQYMFASRWHSSDLAAVLVDSLVPDHSLVERCIEVAPNGIHLFLPPAGGSEIRELWLRHPKRFEITLIVVDILRELYDVVLVDISSAEGVLPFALNTKSDARVIVSSNEPASVHLLGTKYAQEANSPGDSQISLLINTLWEKALSKKDIEDFLSIHPNLSNSLHILDPLPFDTRGRNWVGTGNTFYTESSPGTKAHLERIVATLLHSHQLVCIEGDQQIKQGTTGNLLEKLLGFVTRLQKRQPRHNKTDTILPSESTETRLLERKQVLVEHSSETHSFGALTVKENSPTLLMPSGQGTSSLNRPPIVPLSIEKSSDDENSSLKVETLKSLYQSPELVENIKDELK